MELTMDEIEKLPAIYEDEYILVRDPGTGLINISVKKEGPVIPTSMPEVIPPQAQRVCNLLGCTFVQLQKYIIDDVKKELKTRQMKRNSQKKSIQVNMEPNPA